MKILLLDDHALFRAGLKLLLKTLEPHAAIFEAGTSQEAIELVTRNPDTYLCLLDIHLRNESGLDVVAQLKSLAENLVVVVVSAAEESALIRECIHAGAMSFINKSVMPEAFSEALRFVLSGEIYIPPVMRDDDDSAHTQHISLSPRQKDVLRCLCRGMPTKTIASNLDLSEHTVKDYIGSLFQILQVKNRTEAVIKAGQMRLVSEYRAP